jgi:hypothetical protein
MDDLKFFESTSEWVDTPCDMRAGRSCLAMMLKFYRKHGVTFPDEFRGFTEDNFAERWLRGEGRPEWEEFLTTIGKPVEVNFARKGDLIVGKVENMLFSGIYLSASKVLMMFETGAKVVPFEPLRPFVTHVRRLID